MRDLQLGGEVYVPISSSSFTAAYDFYVQQVLEDAGITDLLTEQARLPKELAEPAGKLFMRQLARSGKITELAAAFVQPKNGRWSPGWAIETAKKLEVLTAEPEKNLLRMILIKGINDFFLFGRLSLKTSH